MTKYEEYINKAEYCFYKGRYGSEDHYYKEAIEYYELALKEKQAGSITKKRITENIEELKNELSGENITKLD